MLGLRVALSRFLRSARRRSVVITQPRNGGPLHVGACHLYTHRLTLDRVLYWRLAPNTVAGENKLACALRRCSQWQFRYVVPARCGWTAQRLRPRRRRRPRVSLRVRRTSPAANTVGMLVSNGSGVRPSAVQVAPSSSGFSWASVWMNPTLSRAKVPKPLGCRSCSDEAEQPGAQVFRYVTGGIVGEGDSLK